MTENVATIKIVKQVQQDCFGQVTAQELLQKVTIRQRDLEHYKASNPENAQLCQWHHASICMH